MIKIKKQNFKLVLLLLSVALVSSACSISTTSLGTSSSSSSSATEKDASVFLSTDRGDNWRIMTNLISANGRAASINDINVNVMTMDPQDNLAIYLASYGNGLYYTYNIANGWNSVSTLTTGTINDVKVDPKNKCVLYASATNRLYRSNDCARTWKQVYYDSNTAINVSTIAIDQFNTNIVYIGTSRGEIIKSVDSGESWQTIQRLEEGVARLIISPLDSRLIFVATAKNRIFSFSPLSSTDSSTPIGENNDVLVDKWTDLNSVLADYNLGSSFKDFIICLQDGTMFIATDKLILRSPDNGITWESIKLIQPEKDAVINALAVNPRNSQELYYVTNTTFFRSVDGGLTWTTKKLPTKRAGRELLVDFANPSIIYLGTVKLK
jgi:photosystem II stability/assembly factor-like uncharacterized protein